MTTPLLRRSEQLVWLFDDVECCLGQLPPEPSPTITGVAAPDRDLPYYRPQSFVDRPAPDQGWESVARGQLAVASEHLHFRGTGPQYPVGLRLGGALGAVPRRPRRRAARPAQPPGGFPQRRRLVHLQPGLQPGSPVDRDQALRQPPP